MVVPGFVRSRGLRCLWFFEELENFDFEVRMIQTGVPFVDQMKAHGAQHATKVPTLLWDGVEIAESGVISQIVAERYGGPASFVGLPRERIEMMQWTALADSCVTFLVPCLPTLMDEDATRQDITSNAIEPMRRVFARNIQYFENHFRDRQTPYLLQSGFSVADTMCGWSLETLNTWGLAKLDKGTSPLTQSYLERLQSRPVYQRATQYDELELGLYRRGCVQLD